MSRAPRSPSLAVEVVSRGDQMLRLAPVWNELCERSGVSHPFLTHEWVGTWWECFGGEGERSELRVLVVRDCDSTPLGLVPLVADGARMYGLGLARLGFPWNSHTPRFGLLVAERHEEVCRALWEHLWRGDDDWDLLRLCQLPEGTFASRRLAELAAAEGFLVGRWTSSGSPYVPIHGTWGDYLAGLGRKHRATIRNRCRRLAEGGAVELETLDGAGESPEDLARLDRALEEGFRLEAAAWKGAAGTAILSRPETREFYRRLARPAARRGWLRLHFLTVGGRRIAFHYSLLHGGTLYALKGGYDPAFARSSPGLVLYSLILRQAFDEGLSGLDFLGDEEPWKLHWTHRTRAHHWLFVFRPSARTRLVHLLKFGLAPRARRRADDRGVLAVRSAESAP
jgi:CelD/BcsL family acetyltransferase involved in cellulose biosynthesis